MAGLPRQSGGRVFRPGVTKRRPGPPKATQRLINNDACEPGPEGRLPAKALEPRERADVGILHGILGVGIVSQDPARNPVQPLVVTARQLAHRLLIPRQAALGEGGVSHISMMHLAAERFPNPISSTYGL